MQKGTALVEVLLAIVTVSVLVLLLANIPNSIRLITKSRHQSLAREIVSKAIEDVRATQYGNLTDGNTNLADSRLSLLPSGSATRIIEDCPTKLPTICTQGEHTKHIKVTVTWKESGQNQSAIVDTMVSEGGLK